MLYTFFPVIAAHHNKPRTRNCDYPNYPNYPKLREILTSRTTSRTSRLADLAARAVKEVQNWTVRIRENKSNMSSLTYDTYV